VTIISPQYVKPFVRRQKNDGNDAEAIVTAARQPHIPHVPKKTIEQQDIQAMHRARQRMVNHRTAVVSQIRGLLLDRGFAFAKSITRARRTIPALLSDTTNGLTVMARETIAELWDLLCDLDRRVMTIDKKIDAVFKADPACQRIARIKGVGPKTATAMVAAIGDGTDFKNGRHLAAWLGLVPRQHSSGDKRVMMGISKRGSQHLRRLLVHGARAVVDKRRISMTGRTNGSITFGSGAASTGQRLRLPTKQHGLSGPCCGRANPIAPPTEATDRLRDDGEMDCTDRTDARRA
jgi:transposase